MTESNKPLSKNPDGMKAARVLAQYGDIPVAYAVFHVTLNDDATQVADTEYVFTNALYLEWLGFGDVDLVGRSFMETVPDADSLWFPYCYRAVVQHEGPTIPFTAPKSTAGSPSTSNLPLSTDIASSHSRKSTRSIGSRKSSRRSAIRRT